MNKIAYIVATAAISVFSSVAAYAADGRDPTLYGPTAIVGVVEGRNTAVAVPVVEGRNASSQIVGVYVRGVEPYIADAIRANARSTR